MKSSLFSPSYNGYSLSKTETEEKMRDAFPGQKLYMKK
jgi:hypothetical protein